MEKRSLFAVILISLGLLIYLANFVTIFKLSVLWPLLIIVLGLGIMFRDLYNN